MRCSVDAQCEAIERKADNAKGGAMPTTESRRHFLTQLATVSVVGLGGIPIRSRSFAAEPPPEVTAISFEKDPVTCIAPQVFQELLRAEGFTEVRYVDVTDARVRSADAAKSDVVSDMI